MKIVIISLFLAFVLDGFNIQYHIRYILAKIKGKSIESMYSVQLKMIDCFPCFSWWIGCSVTLLEFIFTGTIEFLPAMMVFILAKFYDKYGK